MIQSPILRDSWWDLHAHAKAMIVFCVSFVLHAALNQWVPTLVKTACTNECWFLWICHGSLCLCSAASDRTHFMSSPPGPQYCCVRGVHAYWHASFNSIQELSRWIMCIIVDCWWIETQPLQQLQLMCSSLPLLEDGREPKSAQWQMQLYVRFQVQYHWRQGDTARRANETCLRKSWRAKNQAHLCTSLWIWLHGCWPVWSVEGKDCVSENEATASLSPRHAERLRKRSIYFERQIREETKKYKLQNRAWLTSPG